MRIIFFFVVLAFAACDSGNRLPKSEQTASANVQKPISGEWNLTPEEWKSRLSAEAYNVLREEGTERAFSGKYWDNHDKGEYLCAGCQLPLFSSETKFESGTGWPSFWQPLNDTCTTEKTDNAYGMERTEVECARCGGHLGHVFNDGPKPSGLRFCMNSVSMTFVPEKGK